MLNIFDAYGHVSADIDPAAVEALPDSQRNSLFAALQCCKFAEAGEERVSVARKRRDELNRSHDACLAADHLANPPTTHQQALLAVSEANRLGRDYKPAKSKANEKTRAALAAVIVELSEARAEVTQAEAALRSLSAKRADAVMAWMNSGEKITAESVHREMVAAQADRKLAILNGEIEAPKVATVKHQSHLDAVLAGPGKSISRGNRRPSYPVR